MNDNLFQGLVSILPAIFFYSGFEALFVSGGPIPLTIAFAITSLFFMLTALCGLAWATNDRFAGENLW